MVDLLLVGQVGLEGGRAAELLGDRADTLLAAVPVQRDARALGGECPRARRADAARGARDEDALAAKPGLHRGRLPTVRVHVISDMEGVAGIVKWEQTSGGEPLYEEGRRLYTEEINAAVRGARAAGATEIVVMDCHGAGKGWTFNSLLPDLLEPYCEFVVQEHWTEYTGLPRGGLRRRALRRDARARRDPDGVLNHTVSARRGRTSGSTTCSSARPGSTPRSAAPGPARC